MLKFVESRKSQRADISMTVALYDIAANQTIKNAESYSVEVENISQSGIGFVTDCQINVGSFYKASLVFPTKDKMDVIIEVVRSQIRDNGEQMYGGTFVALNDTDKFKIEVYRIFAEQNK